MAADGPCACRFPACSVLASHAGAQELVQEQAGLRAQLEAAQAALQAAQAAEAARAGELEQVGSARDTILLEGISGTLAAVLCPWPRSAAPSTTTAAAPVLLSL